VRGMASLRRSLSPGACATGASSRSLQSKPGAGDLHYWLLSQNELQLRSDYSSIVNGYARVHATTKTMSKAISSLIQALASTIGLPLSSLAVA